MEKKQRKTENPSGGRGRAWEEDTFKLQMGGMMSESLEVLLSVSSGDGTKNRI